MRDFNNEGSINVNGNFNVGDNQQHKLLLHCSNEELLSERPFRKENIKIEQRKKIKRLLPFYGLSVVLLFTCAIWAMIKGNADLIAILMGLASVFTGILSIKATLEPNAFQIGEQNAVDEINTLLKQRRVE